MVASAFSCGRLEGQPDDQQRHGEPDAGQRGPAQHLARSDALRQPSQPQAGTGQRTAADADELADHEPHDDRPGERRGQGVDEHAAAQVDPGVGEGEQRNHHVAGPRVQHQLHPLVHRDRPRDGVPRRTARLRQRGLPEGPEADGCVLDDLAARREGGDQQAADHAGDRRVHAGGDRCQPHQQGGQHVRPRPPHAEAGEHDQGEDAGERDAQGHQVDRVGVEHPDHADRDDVVHDGEGEQEHPQLGGDARPDEGERAQQEGRVRPDHHAPAGGSPPRTGRSAGTAAAGTTMPAKPASSGSTTRPSVGEFTDGEVAAHLQADHEEEQHHQAVADPVPDAHLQAERAELDRGRRLPGRGVAGRPRRVRPHAVRRPLRSRGSARCPTRWQGSAAAVRTAARRAGARWSAAAAAEPSSPPQRQPSPGATRRTTLSRTWAL